MGTPPLISISRSRFGTSQQLVFLFLGKYLQLDFATVTMAKQGFSMADLQGGMKSLNNVEAPSEAKKSAGVDEGEVAARKQLEDLYEKHSGDLDLIFADLNANPTKAKKPHNRPKDAAEFARKFLAGFYNLLADDDKDKDASAADSKDSK